MPIQKTKIIMRTKTGIRSRLELIVGLVLFSILPTGIALAQHETPSVNRWCPVSPEKIAKTEFHETHKGVTVNFCSESCKNEFKSSPERYEENLKRTSQNGQTNPLLIEENNQAEKQGNLNVATAAIFVQQHSKLLMMLALSLSIFLLADLIKRRREKRNDESTVKDRPTVYYFAKPYFLLIMMQFSVIAHLIFFNEEGTSSSSVLIYPYDETSDIAWRMLERQSDIYRQSSLRQNADEKDQLKVAYEVVSRENPDKSQVTKQMTMGTLFAEIRNDQGEPLQPGASTKGQKLFLHWEFISTTDRQTDWSVDQLKEMVLLNLTFATRSDSRPIVGSEVCVVRSDRAQTWYGSYPLGDLGTPVAEQITYEGTLYVGQPKENQRGLACIDSAFLAIPYQVGLKNGIVQESSKLWIASLKPDTRSYRLESRRKNQKSP